MALAHEQSVWLFKLVYIFKVHTLLCNVKFNRIFLQKTGWRAVKVHELGFPIYHVFLILIGR